MLRLKPARLRCPVGGEDPLPNELMPPKPGLSQRGQVCNILMEDERLAPLATPEQWPEWRYGSKRDAARSF